MSDIVDLNAMRAARDGPDPEFMRKDDFGRPMYVFAVEYQMGNGEWMTQLWAYDLEDARRRCAAIRESGAVQYQIMGMQPA
jgi:hypothetical protein